MATKKTTVKVPSTIEGKVRRWLTARQLASRAEAIKKTIQPFIAEILEKAPGRTREFGLHTLSLVAVSGARKFNVEKAEAALGKDALAPFFEEQAGHERIVVK